MEKLVNSAASRAKMRPRIERPGIALALGAGGARGLAHIEVLEALDELGIRPVAIAGSSIGAVLGAAYAAGVSGREIRLHVLAALRNRAEVMSRLLRARVGRISDFLTTFTNPVLMDAEILLDTFWPGAVPDTFEALAIPLIVVATDYYGRCEVTFGSGPLAPAVAGSMAIPGLIRPVEARGYILVDGGAVNPLPYEHLFATGAFTLACDVAGGPPDQLRRVPTPFEAMFGAAQIMQRSITTQMLKVRAPDLIVRPEISAFRALDFFRAKDILRAAAPVKDQIKRSLEFHLGADCSTDGV
jgi:NTE family protein